MPSRKHWRDSGRGQSAFPQVLLEGRHNALPQVLVRFSSPALMLLRFFCRDAGGRPKSFPPNTFRKSGYSENHCHTDYLQIMRREHNTCTAPQLEPRHRELFAYTTKSLCIYQTVPVISNPQSPQGTEKNDSQPGNSQHLSVELRRRELEGAIVHGHELDPFFSSRTLWFRT